MVRGIESSIYFMLAMMFVGMPTAVIGGITWECRKRTRAAEAAEISEDDSMVPTEPSAKPR
ncbi:MAG: hypothetical protein AB8G99_11680 [Planctomycetaceae bacterium]